jgi:filamentous hemagglutinin family protein
MAFVLAPAQAQSILPTNGVVASGAASIRQSGPALSVIQTSPSAIVNWGSFSIGQSNGVTFDQPNAASAILNRVTGSTTSTIAGQMQANGRVYLVNPNGIAITPTGAVQVGGGFVASTLGIADNDFNKGNLNFVGKGASARVSNAGSIAAAPGGFVGLLGGTVANSGVVSVPLGKVAMGSGEQATLNLTGDNFLQVAVPTNTKTADGQALIDVSGKVRAAGGSVQLKAATVAQAIRNAVNVPGELSVTSARTSGGSIILDGGPGGDVSVTGRLRASGRTAGGTIAIRGRDVAMRQAKLAADSAKGRGGSIAVTGTNAVSLASSSVDASGATGGGAIRIGGETKAATRSVSLDTASALNADATGPGAGGAISVWSTGATSVHGSLSARGGTSGGDGGRIETSGMTVDFGGASVDASAPRGKAGTWLVDPEDLTVDGAAATTIQNSLNSGTAVALQTTFTTASGPGNISSGAGDINVDAAISWSTSALLTLSAYHSIIFDAPMTISGAGNLSLTTNNNVGGTSSGGALTFTMGKGSVQFTAPPTELSPLTINSEPYNLISDMAGMESMNGSAGNFALAVPINAAGSGTFPASPVPTFSGKFEGLGNTISNLTVLATGTVTTGNTTRLGLFGLVTGGTIENVGLVGGSVTNASTHAVSNPSGTANASIGELVGSDNGGTITNVYATGAVDGGVETQSNIGGLVGALGALTGNPIAGMVANSYATVAVSGRGTDGLIGGLVGLSSTHSAITNSYATGIVSGVGGSDVGGLIGENESSSITGSYATGEVTSGGDAGGLVGDNFGSIQTSYATGRVSGSGGGASIGGLVGYNLGTLQTSYATGAVSSSGSNAGVGGLVGLNDSDSDLRTGGGVVQTSYATGAVSSTGARSDAGGLIGANFNTVQISYATGAVSGTGDSTVTGGLIGANFGGAVLNSYWDTQTTGQPSSAGGTGLTTAQLQGALPSGFTAPWATGAGLYPFLTSFFPNGGQAVSGFAYKDGGVTPLASGLSGAATVSANVNGATLGNATTGANGYYYIFAPSGSIPAGANVVAYTQADTVTGATNAATYFVSAGANNSSGNDIFGSTLTETTPNILYSQLAAGLANAAGADSGALAAIAGVSNINIFASGASFTVDQAIATPNNLSIQTTLATAPMTISDPIAESNAGKLTLSTNGGGTLAIGAALSTAAGALTLTGATVLDPPVTTSGGNITFNGPVTLSADTTVDSGTGATTFVSTVDGNHMLTVSGSVVDFGAKVGSITPLAGLDVTGLVNLFGNLTTSNGSITFNNAVLVNENIALNSGTASTTFGSTVDSGDCACNFAATAGVLSFGGALGGINPLGKVGLASINSMTVPSITAAQIGALSDANLTLAPGTVLTASSPGAAVILAAGLGFINDSGSGAINLTGSAITPPIPGAAPIFPYWQVYSANPANDVFSGLNSNNTAIWNTLVDQPVTAPGNHYIFAFQPTITVTSTNDTKTYGQDVTARVASDFVISGLQPGVPGAFLGDSAAAVHSGTPSVTSLGSPARASVAGSPYPITVAQGTFTVSDGYGLVLDSVGKLTVAPLPITFSVADATSTYGTTATLGTATLFGVLPGDTVDPTVGAFSGTRGVAIGPRTPAGVYSQEVTALSNPNYTIAASGNTPGALTIDPRTVTFSVADTSSIFGTMPFVGPATLFGVLPGDIVDTTLGAFSGATPLPLNPLTPVGRYSVLVTALSNPNYRIAPAPNFPGVLTVTAATANPGAPSDPGFLPGLTRINNPAQTEYDVGGYEQVLPHFTVACNEPPSLPDPNRFSDPDQALRAISQSMESYFRRCQNPTQSTIGDALDEYAAKLQVLVPRLPPALRNVPAIVAEGARRVRAARSKTEAVAVLRQTVAAVHKEIALVLSEDPATRGRELRDGDVVAGALDQTSVALVNSGGL